MNANWPLVKLGDYVDLFTGNPFKSKDFSDSEGVKLLRGDNIVQGKFRWENVKRWPESLLIEKHQSYFLQEGDVILAMDRPWIEAGLKYSQISKHDLPCLLVQRTSCLRAKAGLRQDFLKYVIASYDFVEYVKLVQTGTAVPHISGKQIKDFEFKLPPESVQKTIGRILKTLDSKVQLNVQTNQTLEQIAQAIFKSWFVDFEPVKAKIAAREALIANNPTATAQQIAEAEQQAAIKAISGASDVVPTERLQTLAELFPNQLVESELGDIPEGWQVKALDEIAHYQNGLALQKFRPEEGEDFLPVLKIAQLKAGFADGKEVAKSSIKPECIVENGDVIFSWSGSLVVDIWCGGKVALNQHLFKVTSKDYPKWFYFNWTKHHLAQFQQIAADKAVTMGHIKRSHLSEAKCIIPSEELMENDDIANIINKQIECRLESSTLSDLRDVLLPKLLSGEVTTNYQRN